MRDLLGGRSQQLTAHLRSLTTANLVSLGRHTAQDSVGNAKGSRCIDHVWDLEEIADLVKV